MKPVPHIIGMLLLLLVMSSATADTVRIAVASNFAAAAKELAALYARETGQVIQLAFSSTGKHYAQIRNGAPFRAFFAADAERPERLEAEGLALPGSRFSYALGRLVLWSPDADRVDAAGAVLERGAFRHLAVANPKLAHYGRAAKELLQKRGLWQTLRRHMVRGENIGQTFQFVKSGNAELGLVAGSQILHETGSRWEVPWNMHAPIVQQAVLLHDYPVARGFMTFVRGAQGRTVIRAHGYGTP